MFFWTLLLGATQSPHLVQLESETWAEQIGNRAAIVSFTSPWCKQCGRDRPVWEQLAQHYASNDSVIVAVADCAGSANRACVALNVDYALTATYSGPSHGALHFRPPLTDEPLAVTSNVSDFASLREFGEANLGPGCGPKSLYACTGTQRRMWYQYFSALSDADLEAARDFAVSAVHDAEKEQFRLKTTLDTMWSDSARRVQAVADEVRELEYIFHGHKKTPVPDLGWSEQCAPQAAPAGQS